MNTFDNKIIESKGLHLQCASLDTLQVNIGLKCNNQCNHCHLKADPFHKEMMSLENMKKIVAIAEMLNPKLIDITGGAPELHPNLRSFIENLKKLGHKVQLRTNLTVLCEESMKDFPQFYADNAIKLVASLPCYFEENVDRQRNEHCFENSITALHILNDLDYGITSGLELDLVHNPIGFHLPTNQRNLEKDYKRELKKHYDVKFNRLLTITNMPIGRFLDQLKKENHFEEYMRLLKDSFNPDTIDSLMCRHQICVGWNGHLYDCDFNFALDKKVDFDAPSHIDDFDRKTLLNRRIVTGNHCFGCTAGHGSSCGGSLL